MQLSVSVAVTKDCYSLELKFYFGELLVRAASC